MEEILAHIFQSLKKTNFLKYHRPELGHFKDMPAVFISDFDFVWTVDAQKKKKMEKLGYFQQYEKHRYHIVRLFILR